MNWEVRVKMTLGALHLELNLKGGLTPLALIGPNGSGKTSTLRAITGAYPGACETLTLGGTRLVDSSEGLACPPEARNVGYVPQGYALFPHLNVLDNVAFGAKGGLEERRASALRLLETLGATTLATRATSALSSGEAQRVALARALMRRPSLLLLDEPLASLDPQGRRRTRRFLVDHLNTQRTPTLVVTHDARDVYALNATVYVLDAGKVIQSGSAEKLKADPANDFVAEFFDAEER